MKRQRSALWQILLGLCAAAVLCGCFEAGVFEDGTISLAFSGLESRTGERLYVAARPADSGITWQAGENVLIPVSGAVSAMVLRDYNSPGQADDFVASGGSSYLISFYVDVDGSGDAGPNSGDYEGEATIIIDGPYTGSFAYPADFTLVP